MRLCHYYSRCSSVPQHRVLQKVQRCLQAMQQRGWSAGSDTTKPTGTTPPQDPAASKTSDLSTALRLGGDSYFNKEILKQIKKKQTEQYFVYTGNNFMDLSSAKEEYLLDDKDLEKVLKMKRKSPYSTHSISDEYIECAWTKDVEKVALQKWGSMERLQTEKMIRQYRSWPRDTGMITGEKSWFTMLKMSFGRDSGAVVLFALLMNLCNAGFKGMVWLMTGSPSMFSEFMHSLGDTLNQLFLAIGRFLSLKNPDASHPYGYRNHVHIWSILSGIVIFSLGCGLTLYHGILGLLHPIVIDYNSYLLALGVLTGTLLTESGSLGYAILEIRKKANQAEMSFISYVKDGDDPLCNVVLLEDTAGVLGVLVCAAAMTGSYMLQMPILDPIGSLVISGMLAGVSAFLFKTNADRLLGKALPYEAEIKKYMESDRFIHAVLDNKTLDFGDESRFKSEVVLDARLITRHFLSTEVDLDAMLVKWQSVKTTGDMEKFLEEFGSQIYDQIVAHVDRKEQDIKRKFPEIRHIDIEPS